MLVSKDYAYSFKGDLLSYLVSVGMDALDSRVNGVIAPNQSHGDGLTRRQYRYFAQNFGGWCSDNDPRNSDYKPFEIPGAPLQGADKSSWTPGYHEVRQRT